MENKEAEDLCISASNICEKLTYKGGGLNNHMAWKVLIR